MTAVRLALIAPEFEELRRRVMPSDRQEVLELQAHDYNTFLYGAGPYRLSVAALMAYENALDAEKFPKPEDRQQFLHHANDLLRLAKAWEPAKHPSQARTADILEGPWAKHDAKDDEAGLGLS